MSGSSQRRDYALTHLMAHLSGKHDSTRLFDLIEGKGFLALQAEQLEGFEQGQRDLASCALPAAIATEDWQRFLRYSLTAINLGSLAEGLAEEPILRNLTLHGRRALAASLVRQVGDPHRRARGRAALLGTLLQENGSAPEPGRSKDEEEERLAEDLETVSPPAEPGAARDWLETLRLLARSLDPAWLQSRWAGWVGRLGPLPDADLRAELRRECWLILVDRWMERDVGAGSGLWEALHALRSLGKEPPDRDPLSLDPVLTSLPRRLAAKLARSGNRLEDPLPAPLDADDQMLWHLRLATWAGDTLSAEPLDRVGDRLMRETVPWTPELVEVGRGLWSRLGSVRLQALTKTIGDSAVRAGLFIVALEEEWEGSSESRGLDEAACRSVEEISGRDGQFHWYLRYLAARNSALAEPARLLPVVRYLERARYGGRVEDLARFLDLVAETLPEMLDRQVDGAVWSPETSGERLLTLARLARSRGVLNRLLDRAEEYAAVVASTQPEGFRLRCDLLSEVTRRLCAQGNDPSSLCRVVPRLLPEEEDRVRMSLVEALAGRQDGDALAREFSRELAECVSRGIRSRRLRLLAWLRVVSDQQRLERVLRPASLYQAVASTQVAEDELHALAPMIEGAPADPAELADRHVSRVRDPDRRVLALADLARASLTFQRREHGARWLDSIAALEPLRQQAGALSSDARLALFTPELVAAVSLAEPRRVLVEFQEAMRRVLTFGEIDDSLRFEVIERLVAGLVEAAFVGTFVETGGEPSRRRCRAVAQAVRWLARLPSRSEFQAPDLRRLWPRLLPLVAALPERLPSLSVAYLRHPWRARFLVDGVPTLTGLVGLQRLWLFCSRLEHLATLGWIDRRRSPWVRGEEGFAAWMAPCQWEPLAAFLQRDQERFDSCVERAIEKGEVDELELETLAFLASSLSSGKVPDLVQRAAPGAVRDDLALRLLRGGWLGGDPAGQVIESIGDEAIRLQARAWSDLSAKPDRQWLSSVEKLVGDHGLDLLDPRYAELRRKALRTDRAEACVAFARATATAADDGSREWSDSSLQMWLQAFLLLPPGAPGGVAGVEAAIAAAQVFPG